VHCDTQAELDRYWKKLTSGGGKEVQCGWLKDKYGLSWQIVPTALGELMSDPDPEKSKRVMSAMLQMTRIDIKKLKQAYDQR
jgi:predicted 3-demethylubiquinone-9 3-methyltransferase (glyoxalase superfamily)